MEFFCKDCEDRFNKQGGELRLLDMCEECKTKCLLSILEPDEDINQTVMN